MAEIIGVKFKEVGKIYYFDPLNMTFQSDEKVIVETARGIECGTVALPNKDIDDKNVSQPLKPVLRKATEDDIRHIADNHKKEEEAFGICAEKIREHKLEMKLVDVEYTFDNNKILFYFTADGRIDFRELVKDLATVFRTRIELRQIGVRDEAKMLGGLGVCGRPLCCNSFLGEFQPVSIKMAKEQGLSLSPVKISGTCGRLMCCLKYEQDAYIDLINHSPKLGTHVKTPIGNGIVTEVLLLTGYVKVKMDGSVDAAAPQIFAVKDLKTLDDGVFVELEQDDEEFPEEEIAMLLEDEPAEKTEKKDSRRLNKGKNNHKSNFNNRKKPQQKAEQNSGKDNVNEKDFSDYKPKEKNRQRKNTSGKPSQKSNRKNSFGKSSKSQQPHYRKPKGEKNK